MKKTAYIPDLFPKHLFWDVDYSKLNVEKDRSLIIPRALFDATPKTFEISIQKLEELYSRDVILDELKKTKERVSNDICELVAARYDVPIFHRFVR